jgi:hypothetical protein
MFLISSYDTLLPGRRCESNERVQKIGFSHLLEYPTVGPIGQKALNKVVSHTDATMTLLDATIRYQTIPDDTRRYQTLLDFQIQQYFWESSLTNIRNSWIRKIRQNEKVEKLLLNLD